MFPKLTECPNRYRYVIFLNGVWISGQPNNIRDAYQRAKTYPGPVRIDRHKGYTATTVYRKGA